MGLLSANDYNTLSAALRRGDEIELVRSLGDWKVTAKTIKSKAPWPVFMIVQVQEHKGNVTWTQNFESVEEAKRVYER